MRPEKIRSLLIENKVKQVEIARELNVSSGAVNRVIDRHFVSHRIREAIAAKVRVPFKKMWGSAA